MLCLQENDDDDDDDKELGDEKKQKMEKTPRMLSFLNLYIVCVSDHQSTNALGGHLTLVERD
jgi:hypothetical protein